MKKTLNINLAGYPFTIDDDAYQLLKDYLDTIRYAFETNEDTEDLASDIESRIAEILIEKEQGGIRIVTLEEVSKVIERIGKPSDFIEVEDEPSRVEETTKEEIRIEEEETITPPPHIPPTQPEETYIKKKFFRDPQNALLGGVCSGVAYYLDVDVTVVRLLTVLLFFLSGSIVAIVYIVLWIVMPVADTPIKRMQMKGELPSVKNIGKTITENYQENENLDNPNNKGGFYGFLSSALSIFVKCLVILGLIIAIPLLIAFSAALLGCLIAVFVIGIGIAGGGMFDTVAEGLMVLYILLAVIGGVITLGVPLWLFVRMVWKKNESNLNQTTRRSLLIVWLCGLAMTAVFTVKAVKQYHKIDVVEHVESIEKLGDFISENDTIENIKIDDEGIMIESGNNKQVLINGSGISIEKTKETVSEEVAIDVKTDSLKNDMVVELKDQVVKDSISNKPSIINEN